MNRELIGRIDARRSNEILAVDAYDGELLTLLADCKAALSQAEPVASVPQDVEEFIESSTRKMKDVDGFIIDAVYTDDLRAWMAGHARVPVEPNQAMLDAARDWSYKKYDKPIGNDAAIGCWSAMLTASKERTEQSASQQDGV